jgi:anion-transporting  ArsA/GET3 family ATPase
LKKSKKTILQIIEGWKDLSQRVLDFIRDREKTNYVIVTIAEGLGVRLTERLLKDFDDFHLTVRHLIVNNLVQEADCDFHRQRQAMQRKYLKTLNDQYGQRMSLVEIPLLPYEVRGVKRIAQLSEILFPPGPG